MNKILVGATGAAGLGLIVAATVIASGVIDVGADTPHSSAAFSILSYARERAIARSSGEINAPANLGEPERIRRGAGNYAAMCVNCHLSPGNADSEIRKGLYPTPPNLSQQLAGAPNERDAARRFWIIKHGVKASGMPAWSKGGMDDKSIWDLVAFLQKMPTLSKADYDQLVASSEGHSHGGLDSPASQGDHHGQADEMNTQPVKPHVHEHGGHSHAQHAH